MRSERANTGHNMRTISFLLLCLVIINIIQSFSLNWFTPLKKQQRLHLSSIYEFDDTKISTKNVIPYDKKPRLITELISSSNFQAIKIRIIKLRTYELAKDLRKMLTTGDNDFNYFAKTMSLCDVSKSNGGNIGWISLPYNNTMFDYLPLDIVNQAINSNKGDIYISNTTMNDENFYYITQVDDIITKLSPTFLKNKQDNYRLLNDINDYKYSISTMGCQMNTRDSQIMEDKLIELGYSKVENPDEANLVIVNTCSIRDHAEQKVYSYLGTHAQRKRKGENIKLVIAGCVAQQEGEKIIKRFPEVDLVMGPAYANRLSDLLESVSEGYQIVATDPTIINEDNNSNFLPKKKSDSIAFVNVIYGCLERCSYCVVPELRGVEQSRTMDAIVNEIQLLVQNGVKEVTLLGQNIDSWGRDFTPKQKFADLLNKIASSVEGLERLRFLTSHPKYMSKRVVDTVFNNSIICPNFNIPFQSGSNNILHNMRRGYTRERYLEIINYIKEKIPDASFTADVIVGFPGETEDDFQDTLDLMDTVKFDMLNTAAYSKRPNTPAADWDNQIDDNIKEDRLQRINRLASIHALERSERFVDRVMDVLVEEVNPKNPTQVIGRIPHNRIVYFTGNIAALKGKVVKAKIIQARPYSLIGELLL